MHILSGEIRNAPYTKEGNNSNGRWKMYTIELSERVKPRNGDPTYTNYRATLFASENQIQYYDEWLAQGKFVTITAKQLTTKTFDTQNGVGVSLEMVEAQLHTFQSSGNAGQRPQKQQQQQQQASQPQKSKQTQSQNSTPDFDDDIPF